MKTIIVEGCNWSVAIDVDEEIFPKYTDMTLEAMTQGVERFFQNKYDCIIEGEEIGLGFALTAYESGGKGDIEKEVAALTELVLRNAGYHDLAEEARREAIAAMRKGGGR